MAMDKVSARRRRQKRVRFKLRSQRHQSPRLTVFRSSRHIYAQIVDDSLGRTVAAASTLDKELAGQLKTGGDQKAAEAVGRLVAARALKAGIETVVFDRGSYVYHGRVKSLASAAREEGLKF